MASLLFLATSIILCSGAEPPSARNDACEARDAAPTAPTAAVGMDDAGSLLQTLWKDVGGERGGSKHRRVFVTRHCVRGTGTPDLDKQAYAALPFADWDSPDKWCLGGGFAIAKTLGTFLKEHYGVAVGKVALTNDDVMRKLQTGQALMAGIFGSEPPVWNLETNGLLMAPTEFGCDAPDQATQRAEVKHLLETTPMPNGLGLPQDVDPARWEAELESFQRIIGTGTKDIMTLTPPSFAQDVTWDSKKNKLRIGGSVSVLKYFGQQLFYAKAAGPGLEGKPITFGGQPLNVSIDDLYPQYHWLHYQRQVSNAPSLKAVNGVALADAVLKQLTHGTRPGHTHIFACSDTQIDSLRELFNITWDAPPFGGSPGPTPPDIGLMFTTSQAGEVDVEVVSVKFDGTLAPPIRAMPAHPANTSLALLRQHMQAALERHPAAAACARKIL